MFDGHVKLYNKLANIIARNAGYGKATKIVRGSADRVISAVSAGYVKNTTGEYVSNAYRKKGWGSVHYVNAECVVQLKG